MEAKGTWQGLEEVAEWQGKISLSVFECSWAASNLFFQHPYVQCMNPIHSISATTHGLKLARSLIKMKKKQLLIGYPSDEIYLFHNPPSTYHVCVYVCTPNKLT